MTDFNLGRCVVRLPDAFKHHTTMFVGPVEEAETVRLALIKKRVPFRPNLVITGSAASLPPEGLRAYVESQIAALLPLKGFRQIGREDVRCNDGTSGVLQHHAFDNEDGVNVEQYQLYVRLDDRALIATTTHLAGEPFKRYQDTFKDILMNISLTN
jgi:hypothetical protein